MATPANAPAPAPAPVAGPAVAPATAPTGAPAAPVAAPNTQYTPVATPAYTPVTGGPQVQSYPQQPGVQSYPYTGYQQGPSKTPLVLGIIGIIVSIFLPLIGFTLGLIALIMSIRQRAQKTLAPKILGIIAMVLSVFLTFAYSNFLLNNLGDIEESVDLARQGISESNEKSYGTSTKDESEIDVPPYEILENAKFVNTYDDTPAIQITVKWTNTTDDVARFSQVFDVKAFQEGFSLERGYGHIDSENDDFTEIQPGTTQEVILIFETRSEEDVTFEMLTGYEISYEQEKLESKTFTASEKDSGKDDASKEPKKQVRLDR